MEEQDRQERSRSCSGDRDQLTVDSNLEGPENAVFPLHDTEDFTRVERPLHPG
jgi:hypothetical protein